MLRSVVLATLAFSAPSIPAVGQIQPSRELLLDAGRSVQTTPTTVGVIRERLVQIDVEVLQSLQPGDFVRLRLFDDAEVTVLITEEHDVPRPHRGLFGTVEDDATGDLVMVSGDDYLAASVRSAAHGLVRIRCDHGRFHVVEQIDESQMPRCGTDASYEVSAPDSGGRARPRDNSDRIDVMVVFTKLAQTAAGGMNAMNALIDLAILETNLAYEDSGVDTRLNLVYKAKIGYNESSDFGTHLSRITGNGDGFMDEVHAIRSAVGADQVALIVRDGQYCGIAYLMTSLSSGFRSSAFSVTHYGCATGYYSFGHELGHNQGCHHDHDNAGGALYSYSYGHRFIGNSGRQYRTMLAYSPGTRIRRLSSPNHDFDGVATGVASGPDAADNSRSLNNADATVANWYDEVEDVDGFLFSSRNNMTVGGLSWNDEDVVLLDLDTGNFSMMIDMSDLIPGGVDLVALSEAGSPTEFLLSFEAQVDIPGLVGGPNGTLVEPQDLVKLSVSQFGTDTAGSFEFFLDGSDIGLDIDGESIDAVSMAANGDLYLSTLAAYTVPGVSGRDEDILRFVPTSTGASSAGTFSLEMHGRADDVKLNSSGEDVDAHHRDASGNLVLSTTGSFRVPANRTGEDDDLLRFLPTASGLGTTGTFMNLFNGDHYGLDSGDIDALSIND